MKKVLIIFLSSMIFISSFLFNTKKAEAVALPLVVPAAAAVGVYAVGMTTAILLTAENQKSVIENFQQTLPQAKEDWKNFSDSTKEGIVNAYNSAVETGSTFISLTPALLEAMQNKFATSYPDVSGLSGIGEAVNFKIKTQNKSSVQFGIDKDLYFYLSNGSVVRRAQASYIALTYHYDSFAGFYKLNLDGLGYEFHSKQKPHDFTNINSIVGVISAYNSLNDSAIKIVNVSTLSTMPDNVLTNKDYWDSQIDKVLQKDNTGSYQIPIPNVVAYPPLAGSPDIPDKTTELLWNPSTGQWTLPDGVPFEGNPVVETAPPGTVTLEDGTTVTTIPQTDVTTGETVNVDITTGEAISTGEGVGEGEGTAEGDLPNSKPNDTLNKFKNLVTTKFPFSLPWDLLAVVGVINAEPVPPVFEVNEQMEFMDVSVPFKFKHTVDWMDPYLPFFKSFIVLGYILFLILVTRRLLGGAQ